MQQGDTPSDPVSTSPEDGPDIDLQGWPIQADRMAVRIPLLECLRVLAGHYGRRTSINALTAGLPMYKRSITPALFVRAADRADMTAKLIERPLAALALTPNLPCILVLEKGQACILWQVDHPGDAPPRKEPGKEAAVHPETSFVLQFPETESERGTLTLKELSKLYTGHAFFLRPVARSDERAGPAEIDTARDWFWASLKQHGRIYKQVAIATVMVNLFTVAGTLFTMNVYDRVVPNKAFDTLWVLFAGVLTVFIFDFILKNLRAIFLDYAGKKADVKISALLFEQLLGMRLASRPSSAGVLASNMREFESIRDFFTSATMTGLVDLPFAFLFIVIIAIIGGPLAFVPTAMIPLVLIGGWVMQRPLHKIMRASLQESALKNALLFETITGLETIKTQASEGNAQRRWEELTQKAAVTSAKSKRVSTFATNYAGFIQQFTNIATVAVGVYLIDAGMLTMGALIASTILAGKVMAPFSSLAGLLTRFNQTWQSLGQLQELMKKPVERPAGKHFISMPEIQGKIEFRGVVFHYPEQSVPALSNLDFTIEPGERIGIIGAVGSGKTTIERLLLNLYQPDSGSVQIDGTDVRQIDLGDLRRNIGSVQQSPQLFYGSVRDNITMGQETTPDRAVLRAAELAGVMEFLRDSQAGLDTQVGERGEALSGGQRQAVAIARALLYDPPVLVLDEPTASMDPGSEARLLARLKTLTEGRTTIVITHKGAMLALVDKLILLDRGKILAYGPKDDVIRKLQSRQYGPEGSAA